MAQSSSNTVPGPPAEELDAAPVGLILPHGMLARVSRAVEHHTGEMVYMRRWLHARPELSRFEHETTAALRERLVAEGLEPRVLPSGTGLLCDIGRSGPMLAIRADIDALSMEETTDAPYRSIHAGSCHACGHDVHTSIVLGAGLVLHQILREGPVRGRVRLIFEPAEESIPGGALDVIDAGGLDGIGAIIGMHCDPKLDAGKLGCRIGAITSASDYVRIRLTGPGGHTARPGLTVNLTEEVAKLVLLLPDAVQAAVDGAATRLVFGTLDSGSAANVIPSEALLRGTMRTPDPLTWDAMGHVVPHAVASVLGTDIRPDRDGTQGSRADGLHWHLLHRRGVPTVVNDPATTRTMAAAARGLGGADAVIDTAQSWGGDTFGWYLHQVPGSYARLGTHWPGRVDRLDLHRPSFDVDEAAIPFGTKVFVASALEWLAKEQARPA